MSDLEHEKAFEDYLARRSGISQRLDDVENLEPPPELDRLVLANAREAIRVRTAPPPYRPMRWALPVGLAATVVLSFAVLLHMGLLPRATKDAEQDIEAHFHVEESVPMASTSQPASATPPAAPAPAPAPAAESKVELETSPARDALAKSADRREAFEERQARSKMEGVAANGVAQSAARADAAPEDPATWLRRIRALRTEGRTTDADREWQAFRKAWPDYPVPADLKP